MGKKSDVSTNRPQAIWRAVGRQESSLAKKSEDSGYKIVVAPGS